MFLPADGFLDMSGEVDTEALRQTPMHAWHLANGGRMTSFARYDMPIRYTPGIIAEHQHTRSAVGMFDVSHMGVVELTAHDGLQETVALALETLVPCDVLNLGEGRQRYTQFLNVDGGIIDDAMVANPAGRDGVLTLVINAGCKRLVVPHLIANLGSVVNVRERTDMALIAVQGPLAETVVAAHCPEVTSTAFMDFRRLNFSITASQSQPSQTITIDISRSGYTGEDGFEIAVHESHGMAVWAALLQHPDVMAIGLGARDSLRLEAGLCLYGQDIDEHTSPIEAGLGWSIQKRRRELLNFPGATRIGAELANGPSRKRTGLRPAGKAPVRAGARLFATADSTDSIGTVTSGGFGPTLNAPLAMGYVTETTSAHGEQIWAELRGERVALTITDPIAVPHRYKR
jgi:aminomethyltransferase